MSGSLTRDKGITRDKDENNRAHLLEVLGTVNEIIHERCLEQFLVHTQLPINVSFKHFEMGKYNPILQMQKLRRQKLSKLCKVIGW